MSEPAKSVSVKTDFGNAAFVIAVFLSLLLLSGKPSLYDVLLHALSNGQVPLPVAEEPKP